MTRDEFKEMRQLFILMIIADNKNGITGYQLQEQYHLPRGNLLRILNDLENGGLVRIEKKAEDRVQKFYFITEKGLEYLEGIKVVWASKFAMMSEMAPPEQYANPFMVPEKIQSRFLRRVDFLENKDDVIDMFRGFRSLLKTFIERLRNRIGVLEETLELVTEIINNVEAMKELDKEQVKKMIEEATKRIHFKDIDFFKTK
ncbi:MAG: winged helix DNA-binding protein [Promethearchaeota archaeon]